MVERKTIGSGITASTRITYDAEEFVAASKKQDFREQMNGDKIDRVRRISEDILQRAGLPLNAGTREFLDQRSNEKRPGQLDHLLIEGLGHDRDSDAGYAARLIEMIETLRIQKKARNIEGVECSAFDIGVLAQEWHMKREHEADAIKGKELSAIRSENLHGHNSKRRAAALEKWPSILAHAVILKETNSELNPSDLARLTAKNLKLNVNSQTLRKKIAKHLASLNQ